MRAIANIQNLVDEIKNQPKKDVQIGSISQGSISISLTGATEAIELIMSVIVPWRYKHSKTMAKLAEGEKLAQIENIKADVLAKRLQAIRDRDNKEKEAVELAKQRAEVERLNLENDKLRLELHREKIQLALDVLNQNAPNLGEAERIDYVTRLLRPLGVLITSELEPKQLIRPDEESESDTG